MDVFWNWLTAATLDHALPFLAGIIAGRAGWLWWLNGAHDSVLRYGHFQRSDPQGLRQHFIAAVNGRGNVIDIANQEVGGLILRVGYYAVLGASVGVVTLVLLVGLPAAQETTIVVRLAQLGTAATFLLALGWKLRRRRHSAVVCFAGEYGESSARWLRISAERSEKDGLPTSAPEYDELEEEPGFWAKWVTG